MNKSVIHCLNSQLFPLLTEGTTLLTPNSRLSVTLDKQYQAFKQSQNEFTWQTPDILPINRWLERLWHDISYQSNETVPLLLKPAQVTYLWERNIRELNQDNLLQLSETADNAIKAWKLIKQWQISLDHPLFTSFDDYSLFKQLGLRFQNQCKEKRYIDIDSVPDYLINCTKHLSTRLPNNILLFGFTELSPLIKYFLSVCEKSGILIKTIEFNKSDSNYHCIQQTTTDQEIETIARWAKQVHELHHHAQIACVFPELAQVRDRIKQQFSHVFAEKSAFNISAGKSLYDYPVIHAAIQLLELNPQKLSYEALSYLLHSPFIGEAETEQMQRAILDRDLRKKNSQEISITEEGVKALKHCRFLAKRLTAFSAHLATNQESQPFSKWAAHFTELLTKIGWPGERSVVSEEYQSIEAWMKVLRDFATLDYVAKPVTFFDAVTFLKKMVKSVTFQPKTPDARIQILGLLEAAGSPFDYIWIAGLDDLHFPPPPKPNPFIPKKLQRELHLPHATAERELRFCSELLQQFQASSSNLLLSYAKQADEMECEISPLIRHIKHISMIDLNLPPYHSPFDSVFNTRSIETIEDDLAPAVLPNEKVKGGVSIIKQQALCPFKAFAEKRLHANAFEDITPGMRPTERGELVHDVLDNIWQKLHSQAALLALSSDELSSLINECVREALLEHKSTLSTRKKYLSLEHKRIVRVIEEWLTVEKLRPPFTVKSTEVASTIQLNQLTIETRIDRIDELSNGKLLIIDYKTGKYNHVYQWLGTRPDEPQLPLYTLLNPAEITGIAFAQLSPGLHGFKGLSEYSLDIEGIKPIFEVSMLSALDWQALLSQWQQHLTSLANDFCAGIARVGPKDDNETCQWCDLKSLCRIHEQSHSEAQ